MKKFAIYGLILIVLIALGVYFIPVLKQKTAAQRAVKIKSNSEIFTTKVLEEFEHNPNSKPSSVAQKLVDELNNTCINPYSKKDKAFTFEASCKGCGSVEYDDNLTMIILTTYDKNGDLSARTVIKPPSFVVFDKSSNNK